jgi:hypothetical protein
MGKVFDYAVNNFRQIFIKAGLRGANRDSTTAKQLIAQLTLRKGKVNIKVSKDITNTADLSAFTSDSLRTEKLVSSGTCFYESIISGYSYYLLRHCPFLDKIMIAYEYPSFHKLGSHIYTLPKHFSKSCH